MHFLTQTIFLILGLYGFLVMVYLTAYAAAKGWYAAAGRKMVYNHTSITIRPTEPKPKKKATK